MATPFVFDDRVAAILAALRDKAAAHPVNMHVVMAKMKTAQGKREHRSAMNKLSVPLPFGFMVTLSIETGHPCGTCRHMSMSSPAQDRVPAPEAVEMVMPALGFVGGIAACQVWLEDLSDGGKAVNLVQPIAATDSGGTA